MFNFGGGFGGHGHGGGRRAAPQREPADTEALYNELGIEKSASSGEIKKAYRRAAMQHHPDKGGDAEKFKAISKAYEILGDAKKRELYDEYGEEGVENGGPPSGGGGGMDIFDLFNGGGGRRGGGRRRQRRGEDVNFPLKVTLADLYNGTTKKLRLTKNVLCSGCDGKGGTGDMQTCRGCKGQGVRIVIRQVGPGMIQQMQTACNDCRGEGVVIADKDRCRQCEGSKTVKEKKTLEVFVNKGMRHGQKITFAGDADEAPDTIPGDVNVILQQIEHDEFTREGDHLFVKRDITLVEALTGFQYAFAHLDGRVLIASSEPGEVMKPGQFKVIRDEGMPSSKNAYVRGHMYIEFNVVFPSSQALADEKVKAALVSLLPPAPAMDIAAVRAAGGGRRKPAGDDEDDQGDEPEDVMLETVDIEAEKHRMAQQRARDRQQQMEEDDDEPQGPGCRAQ